MDAYYTCKLIFGFLGAFAQEFGVGYLGIDGLATGLLPISSLTTPDCKEIVLYRTPLIHC